MKVFSEALVEEARVASRVADLSQATIGEVLLVAQYLERKTGIPFIRMDQGSPGLPPNRYGVEAEKEALDRGVASQYPPADGIPELKKAASRFIKAFIDIDINPLGCIPTTGSVAGSFGSFIACTQRIPGKDKVLFIDPGFPIQKSQLRILGISWREFDIYPYRGEGLRAKLEEQGGVVFCNIPLVEIIQCYILPPDLLFFRQLPQHRRFARLTGTGQQDSGIRFAQFQNPAFHVPSDILHHTPLHDFGRFLIQFYYSRR